MLVNMGKAYDFLMECGVFFLATINGDAPAMRPFGGVMELDGELYVSMANTKDVYSQMKSNPAVQIVALKPGTRDWIRINGSAEEIHDAGAKQKMLDACPRLARHFSSNTDERFALFKIAKADAWLNKNGEFVRI